MTAPDSTVTRHPEHYFDNGTHIIQYLVEYKAKAYHSSPPSLTLTTRNDIRLLQNKPGELIHIMDDQARRSLKKMVHTMTEVFIKRGGNHLSFKFGAMDRSGYATFKYG